MKFTAWITNLSPGQLGLVLGGGVFVIVMACGKLARWVFSP
jgi:hypothetical protein